jgi:ABC-2 type transport system permease protein
VGLHRLVADDEPLSDLGVVTEPWWREWLTEWAPMSAGLAVQATRGLDAMPVGPWQGLAVLGAYAAAALAVGGILLEVRDA